MTAIRQRDYLWRVAPIAPFVVSSVLISMTAIRQRDYLWTTSLGIIPASAPIVSGAALSKSLVTHAELITTTLVINVLTIGAGVYVTVRLGFIAMNVLKPMRESENDRSTESESDDAVVVVDNATVATKDARSVQKAEELL